MSLIEQKELTKEAAVEIVYSAALENFQKIAKAIDLDYSDEEAKDAIMKKADSFELTGTSVESELAVGDSK